jgi:hypothetical protein
MVDIAEIIDAEVDAMLEWIRRAVESMLARKEAGVLHGATSDGPKYLYREAQAGTETAYNSL